MIANRASSMIRASRSKRESKRIEFKAEFDVSSKGAWCEIIKDIVAIANSGGGVILIGVHDDGSISGASVSEIMLVDGADITNRIQHYTGFQFADFEIAELHRGDGKCAAIMISDAGIPMPFVKPGTYDSGGGKQKTAFGQGTVYFRHGAKSETATRDDLLSWRDSEIARVRKSWLGGIRKVVEAPAGHVITVAPALASDPDKASILRARLSNDENAIKVTPRNPNEIWPRRQKEILDILNRGIGKKVVNGHDIYCINRKYHVLDEHPEFVLKPHKRASPQYSDAYAQWMLKEYAQDPKFFAKARQALRTSSPVSQE